MRTLFIFALIIFSSLSARAQWNTSGPHIYNTNSGNVGIGTTTPLNFGGWGRVLDLRGPSDSKIITTTGAGELATGIFSHTTWHGGGGFVGTESNHSFHLLANYTPRLSLLTNGNVGIGTTTPAQRLHVKNSAGSSFVAIDKAGSSYKAGLMFKQGGIVQFCFFTDDANNSLKLRAEGLSGEADATPRIEFPFSTKNIFLAQSGGNVGIGTSSPSELLHVFSASPYPRISVQSSHGSGAPGFDIRDAYGTPKFTWHYNIAAGYMGFFQSGDKMIIKDNGDVGIGTVTPAYKLDVAGVVNATGLYINGSPFNSI